MLSDSETSVAWCTTCQILHYVQNDNIKYGNWIPKSVIVPPSGG